MSAIVDKSNMSAIVDNPKERVVVSDRLHSTLSAIADMAESSIRPLHLVPQVGERQLCLDELVLRGAELFA
jgi:hypothetical protein